MQWKAIALATALTIYALPGLAEDSGVYLGIKAGAYEVEQGDIDSNEFALGAYAGYRYSANLAFEVEWAHLYADGFFGGDFDGDLTVLSAVPILPITDHWDIYAKLGWAWLDFTIDGNAFAPELGTDDDKDDFFWGVGTSWSGEHWEVRGEFQADSGSLWLYTLGLGYRF